jgi:hypothetical protein
MDIDFIIDNGKVVISEKENKKEKQKMKRKSMQAAIDNFWVCAENRILGRTGDC